MENVQDSVELQPLSIYEMIKIEAGALFPWGAVFIAVGVSALTNLPDIIRGGIDGWNAYHR